MDLIQEYTDRCSLCGLCVSVCPSYNDKNIIPILCAHLKTNDPKNEKEKEIEKETEKTALKPEYDIRLCFTCNVCTKTCPEDLGIRKLISLAREKKTKEHGPTKEQSLVDPFSNNNMYRKIGEWEEPVVFEREGRRSEILYFPGCAASCMNKVIGKATVRVLNSAGVDYSVMSGVDYCCGSISYGAGNTEPLQKIGQKNIDEIKARGSKTLITTCPGCYRAFKFIYPKEFGELGFDVLQSSEFFAKLIDEGKLKFKEDMRKHIFGNGKNLKNEKIKIYYQDPCHLTRTLGIYKEPRHAIESIPNVELVNPTPENSICCGFGGGVRISFPQKSLDQAKKVHEIAKRKGSDIIITNCGGCMKNIIEGGRGEKDESGKRAATGLPIYDLTEFISLACGNEPTERDDEKLIRLSNKAMSECLTNYSFEDV
ncbi:MAG: (Fe-S)-binding protein [Methanimicrococcus sp.]|nr:(Fe-S)-binding protein [Methanimicrococcus sp.]